MTTDLVSDMLTRIRNASLAKHSFTTVQYSKQNLAILKVLMSEGFINSYSLEQENNNTQSLKVSLKYKGWWIKKPLFSIIKRISKPGLRVYTKSKELPRVLDNLGIAIMSTSKGVMTNFKAKELGIGGEVLCYIW